MHPHAMIEWDADYSHTPSDTIARGSHEPQRRCSIDLVGVDDVHIAGNKDADAAEAEEC